MSGAIIYIQKDLQITDVQKEVIMGILNVYSLLGSAAAGRTSDWIGRRYTIVFAGAIFFAGALLMGFATNYAFLMVGRFGGHRRRLRPDDCARVHGGGGAGVLPRLPHILCRSIHQFWYVVFCLFHAHDISSGERDVIGWCREFSS
ncbi:UNVERIFIED_CONTAM: putative polyol transporter 1 [Sesamum radiatum]|uniref:Polyol transporter 1 n=1 Tax=Sesamum radiatum TaxID=300843 RepID=A0AAW2S397_SESRA